MSDSVNQLINEELKGIIGQHGTTHIKQPQHDHPDEQEDRLISKDHPQEPQQQSSSSSSVPPAPQPQDPQTAVIDPFHQLIHNNDVVPLLAVLDKLDLNTDVEGKPLLSRLCTMHIPLAQLLSGRRIQFSKDSDNRTALHEAIAADDVASANWCLQNNIGNHRDNFGNTPLLQAIRLGRRACFLLCLHYEYFDSEAAHVCAIYNRAWELKVLHQLRADILWQRDSQHMTPLERAVQNYSYDVAEYITEVESEVEVEELAKKTDSKGILRLINRIKKQNTSLFSTVIPVSCILMNLFAVYYASSLSVFSPYQRQISIFLECILVLYLCLTISSIAMAPEASARSNLMTLLKGPEFPPLAQICPHCLTFQDPAKQHCLKSKTCVPKLHYYQLVCVYKSNEIFSFFIELFWFWLVWTMNNILIRHFQSENLKILVFSSNFLFRTAAIIDELASTQAYLLLAVFWYLKLFVAYQFCCLFQWGYMLVLNRTYREANYSERYPRLYQIGQTNDGSYKSQEIRLMEKGLIKGLCKGINNAIMYFFR